jgi:hypothetical protein
LTKVRQSARQEAGRFCLDAEEIAGEALAKLYAARGRRINNADAYIARTVRHTALTLLAVNRTGRALSGQETQAYRDYGAACAELEQKMKRHLTAAEQDSIAERIWENYDRREPRNFHTRRAPLSGHELRDEAEDYAYHERRSFAEGSLAARVERIADNDAKGNNLAAMREARGLIWDAMAEGTGAPPVARATLSRWYVTELRKRVERAGGARQVAAAWEAGTIDEETACAFFSPFGEIDDAGRRAVVGLMKKYPSYSNELWDAAAGTAAKPR